MKSRFVSDEIAEDVLSDSRYANFDLEGFLKEKDVHYRYYDADDHKELAINCPKCLERGRSTPDVKQKLWINSKEGVFYCYRCDWAGSLLRLVQTITGTDMYQALKILRGQLMDPLEHMNLKLFMEPEEREEDEFSLRSVELPHGYEPIEGPHPYLKKRGIPWEYAARHDWGFSTVGFTKDRIIVPTFMEDRLVFWQARATWESDDDDFKKVLNPKGVSARSVLYNYDVAKKYETIVLCEGFIDAVKVGPNAVATNGKKLHPQQVEWLEKSNAKTVIIMWDRDAWTDARKRKGKLWKPSSIEAAANLLKVSRLAVKAVKMPSKRDPGSYPYHSLKLQTLINKAKSV